MFKDAACFDDLITANLRFLRGELPRTPVHRSPLEPESESILSELAALCAEGRVVTTDSQPSYAEQWEQKEYVQGMWRGSLASFENAMRDEVVFYLALQHGERWERKPATSGFEGDDCTRYFSLTPVNMTGIYVDEYRDDLLDIAQGYDTAKYEVSTDPSVLSFIVADFDFGFPTGQLCRILLKALKTMN